MGRLFGTDGVRGVVEVSNIFGCGWIDHRGQAVQGVVGVSRGNTSCIGRGLAVAGIVVGVVCGAAVGTDLLGHPP